MLAVPCNGEFAEAGQVEIAKLPFPAGTQFFAQAYMPGASGPTRRTVSTVFTVEHSSDSSCLSDHTATLDKRAKSFGKRQVSVIGANTVAATAADSANTPANSVAATTTGSVPPINVVGVGAIPASDSGSVPAVTSDATTVAPTATGAVPPVNVVGTAQIPATGGVVDTPINVVPLPTSGGVVPPVQVIGTSFVTATAAPNAAVTASTTDAAFVPNFTTVQVGADQVTETTSCTSTWTEPPMATETTTSCTDTPAETPILVTMQGEGMSTTTTTAMMYETPSYNSMGDSTDTSAEAPCTDVPGMDSSNMETTTSAYIAAPTVDTASTYGSFDDMVNAANSMFHAWNPYRPAYTPST